MTLLHLLPEDAIIPLETAAKSLEIDPGELLLLLWFHDFEIVVQLKTKEKDLFIGEGRRQMFQSGKFPWLCDQFVRTLASVGVADVCVEPGRYSWAEFLGREQCQVTLSCLSVQSGDVARAIQGPPAPSDQEQKDLSPKRERTLLKLIGALLAMRYTGPAYENSNGGVNVSRMAERMQQDMAKANINDDGLKDRTLRDLIPLAMEAIKENMVPEKGGDG